MLPKDIRKETARRKREEKDIEQTEKVRGREEGRGQGGREEGGEREEGREGGGREGRGRGGDGHVTERHSERNRETETRRERHRADRKGAVIFNMKFLRHFIWTMIRSNHFEKSFWL